MATVTDLAEYIEMGGLNEEFAWIRAQVADLRDSRGDRFVTAEGRACADSGWQMASVEVDMDSLGCQPRRGWSVD